MRWSARGLKLRHRREAGGDSGRRESCDVPLPGAAGPSERRPRLETRPGPGVHAVEGPLLQPTCPGFSPGARFVGPRGRPRDVSVWRAVSGPIEPSVAAGMFFPLVLRGGRHSRPIQPSRFPAEPSASQPIRCPARHTLLVGGVRPSAGRGHSDSPWTGRPITRSFSHPPIAERVHGRQDFTPGGAVRRARGAGAPRVVPGPYSGAKCTQTAWRIRVTGPPSASRVPLRIAAS
jgi:hypothetical protein